jgi:MYXO-CTERM domain-containing protein
VDVGDGTVYDANQHLIWLKDWNVNGTKTWLTQNIWAENLTFAGSGDWHLPSLQQYTDLYGAFGNLGSNTLPFTNVQTDGPYWSGTELSSGFFAWLVYASGTPAPTGAPENSLLYAVAVRSGDVTASVPEPQTWAFMLIGLGAVALASRRPAGWPG